MATALILAHITAVDTPALTGTAQTFAGFGIDVVAAIMGVGHG